MIRSEIVGRIPDRIREDDIITLDYENGDRLSGVGRNIETLPIGVKPKYELTDGERKHCLELFHMARTFDEYEARSVLSAIRQAHPFLLVEAVRDYFDDAETRLARIDNAVDQNRRRGGFNG